MSWGGSLSLVGVHQPGDSWLHRLPAGAKVAGLVAAIAVLLLVSDPAWSAAGALAALLLLWSTGTPWRPLARVARAVAVMLLVIGVVQVWVLGWEAAVVGVSRVAASLALAWAVSLTTPVSAMLPLVAQLARPLRPLGVDPDRVSLVVAMAIRSVPLVVAAAAQADQARLARGQRRSVRALAVPTVVRTVRIADALGDALLARGVGGEPDPGEGLTARGRGPRGRSSSPGDGPPAAG